MTYAQATDFLFNSLPMFQNIGAGAYKPGLESTLALAELFGSPHKRLPKVIHVAGTNGKGSTSSLMAATLTAAGYRTGLYTSPHLVDFRERMRIDGAMIPAANVVDFVERYRASALSATLQPSFFELTTVMAMEWFASQNLDYVVLEVGLGGRIDCTNIVDPTLCIITNISKDHTALLGDTLPEIATEKAGIIKPGVPVVIGEGGDDDVRSVFAGTAAEVGAPIVFADERHAATYVANTEGIDVYDTPRYGRLACPLTGDCQRHNVNTVVTALTILNDPRVTAEAVRRGFADVATLSGLAGRWMQLSVSPLVIADTGHNVGGWQYLSKQIVRTATGRGGRLHMVVGFVNDKDISTILTMMPVEADYYWANASVHRALPSDQLRDLAAQNGLKGEAFPSVADAYSAAMAAAGADDMVFVGGSTFVVADLLLLK